MKKIGICAGIGAVFLALAFLAPLIGMGSFASHPTYWQAFRTLAPLTYTAFILGILALCAAVMLWLVMDWIRHR